MKRQRDIRQEEAIRFKDGPCLVVSGPGSGKTYVLTNRISSLIEKFGVSADSILVITFTRASAIEMENRFKLLMKEKRLKFDKMPAFGTFHSIFFGILRREFGYKSDSKISVCESKKYLIKVLQRMGFKNQNEKLATKILLDINSYKLSVERNEYFKPKYINEKYFYKIYEEYEKSLFNDRKLDFSDMIDICFRLLKSNSDVLKKYQNKYKYILIDEFQDINKSQYELVKLITKSKNIFVVGDDDQSIYSFRGSNPVVMREFIKDYRMARKICLNTNYRSVKNIVNISRKVIDNNKNRIKKDLRAYSISNGSIEIKKFIDSRDENKYILEKIIEYVINGHRLSDIAILYRTNILAESIKTYLEKNGIGCRIKESFDDDTGLKSNSIDDKVSLMTFHLSKGLEFNTVFIIDANDGIIPHKKSIKDEDLETERRLFYVAMTRAKTNLHICFTIRRFGKSYMASRFILEAIGG